MEDSLLVSLRNYRPRPNRDPLEDFVTEAFAWTLRAHPSIGESFLSYIDGKAELSESPAPEEEWTWHTQEKLSRGIADMIVEGYGRTYIFEHKIWAEATAEQIDDYRRSVEADEVITVLVTGARWNYRGPKDSDVGDPDVHLTWAKVSELLSQYSEGADDTERVEDFRALLDHEGLGPRDPLSEPDLRAIPKYQNAINNITSLIQKVRVPAEKWSFAYRNLPDPEDRNVPNTQWSRRPPRYGRISLSLYSNDRPDIRFGVVVSHDDIGTKPVDPHLGPDLAVFLKLPYSDLNRQGKYREIINSDPFKKLRGRIRTDSSDQWTVYGFPSDETSMNEHFPIVIQQPLARVVRGCSSVDAQQSEVFRRLKEGVSLFLKDKEVGQLRGEISRVLET